MDPQIASFLFIIGIAGLFILDHDPESRTSKALWISVAWLAISSSRTVAVWLGVSTEESIDQLVEGSPLDALVFATLLSAGLIVLLARRERTWRFLHANGPLLLFLLYCAVSAIWSEYPVVALKRWTKALGDLVIILLVLTDRNPSEARKRLFARIGFVLIPISILLIKYYPTVGRSYSPWTGVPYNHGVASGKNGLGFICLIFGLASVWRVVESIRAPKSRLRTRALVAHVVILLFVAWLFKMADSATSLACFLMGCAVMLLANLRSLMRRQSLLHAAIAIMLCVVVYGLLLNPDAGMIEMAGRNSTLTGRTALWAQILPLGGNAMFGAGYESFWLGDRLQTIWNANWWHPNQAHNGYLQIFLDLGWAGVVMLGVLIISGYRNIASMLTRDPAAARLGLAYFVAAVACNLTEHAFRDMHPVWIVFLLAVIAVPRTSAVKEPVINREIAQPLRSDLQPAAGYLYGDSI